MLYIASDHAGYPLKEKIKIYLVKQKVKFVDLGTDSIESVDAQDFAIKTVKKVKAQTSNRGILICQSGIMMSVVANRFNGIRAALTWDPAIAKQGREHSDINILVLAGVIASPKNWQKIVITFLKTKTLTKAKYLRRIKKLDSI